MKHRFSLSEEIYDGTQLRSLYNYLQHGLLGDSIVSWIGPCQIDFEHMVDGEDLLAQARIEGSRMVHFIIELFNCDLFAAVNAQRLFAAIVLDQIRQNSRNETLAFALRREGDDLFAGEKKLSISIATVSPVSALIHFAVNVVNEGTPVPTLSLTDLELEAPDFAQKSMHAFSVEMDSIRESTCKVRWVK